ncbi:MULTISPECIES: hypothetical protein [unclassified Streptomyces]|uniref:hypothetical protein n=1 Tax=unclassified Streptomyces TaxID=2593676 RepID=UPI000FFF0BE7|nr:MULTISPECIES: hypothetical protein [unclassified Streptomyces]
MPEQPWLVIVLAADFTDYRAWCKNSGRLPLEGSAYAASDATGIVLTSRRVFQVTDRWKERKRNRAILLQLERARVQYGDETGPWPQERIPDLTWPTWWQRRRNAS